jgi:capsular polysaccharide biosynthesis protein
MNLIKKLSLPSKKVIRKRPCNYKEKDKKLFKNEFTKNLPNVFPIVRGGAFIPPCGRLFHGILFNLFQFNISLSLIGLLKSYLKSFLFLIRARRITRFDNILYVTNSNSHNFFHWFLDVLQKLEFISQSQSEFLNSKLKIIIPNGHKNTFSKKSLEAFNLNFYHQDKNEIIISNKSILLTDLAPTGNYRKRIILKLHHRLRNYWINKINTNGYKKRIYISRKNSEKRKLKNENEIISILKKNSFTIVDFDKLNFEEQISYTLKSEIIVSVHGAGLTHMLWMKKKSKVLEIRAKDNCNDNCYFTLASDLGHNYFYVNAEKTNLKKPYNISDLIINKNDFKSQLLKMLKLK